MIKGGVFIFKDKGKGSKRTAMLLTFSTIILLFSAIALISSSMALTLSERIFYGVKIQELPLGGLTKEEARNRLEKYFQNKLNGHPIIVLSYNGQTWEINAGDIDLAVNAQKVAENAYRVGREANLFKRLWGRAISMHNGIEIAFEPDYDRSRLKTLLSKIAVRIASETENAYCEVSNGKVTIIPEKNGQMLNVDEFSEFLQQKIMRMDLPAQISLPIKFASPEITASDLEGIDQILASYTSSFNHYNTNRSENIKISANSVNRLLIKPDQTVSFNDLVGLRVVEAGFKEAPVIIDGKTVPDIGGGVCQVSSTLYNAILLAGMQPIERTPHFHPLGYVPIGLDATVADNLLDFKFKNTLAHDVYILTQIIEGTLNIFILGSSQDSSGETITLTSNVDRVLPQKTVIEYDPSMPQGKEVVKDEGIQGYIVSSYRIKSRNGKEIGRELLYRDEYTPENRIIVVGTKKSPAMKHTKQKKKKT